MKELQNSYQATALQIQGLLDAQQHAQIPSRATSPTTLFNLPRPKSRSRSNTSTPMPTAQSDYKRLASSFYTINSKYRIAWECAELLVELGTGSSQAANAAPSTPPASTSVPTMPHINTAGLSDKRLRAITLTGEDSPSTATPTGPSPPIASPPDLGWRASTGRHDLSQRQLTLLREMLNVPDEPAVVEEPIAASMPVSDEAMRSTNSVNHGWSWGEPMESRVTLQSEDSAGKAEGSSKPKKRMGLRVLRDMLRNMKKASSQHRGSPVPMSTTSLSTTESSADGRNAQTDPAAGTHGRRRAKTGSESVRSQHRPTSPYLSISSTKVSPRRPSLASIFRIGLKPKSAPGTGPPSSAQQSFTDLYGQSGSDHTPSLHDDEDWDRVEAADTTKRSPRMGNSDLGRTIRGRSAYSPDSQDATPTIPSRVVNNGSQSSLWLDPAAISPQTARRMRLSNVDEDDSVQEQKDKDSQSPNKDKLVSRFAGSVRGGKTGSVRSMPPAFASEIKLAMTPENIKPLLENAKEVHTRLVDCLAELYTLLGGAAEHSSIASCGSSLDSILFRRLCSD